MKRLKKTKKNLISCMDAKVLAVARDAEAQQRAFDIDEQADALEGIVQGLEDVKKGRVVPARKALEAFRRTRTIPR